MNKLDDAFRFQQQALGLLSRRQDILASNIANADTPVIRREISILPGS